MCFVNAFDVVAFTFVDVSNCALCFTGCDECFPVNQACAEFNVPYTGSFKHSNLLFVEVWCAVNHFWCAKVKHFLREMFHFFLCLADCITFFDMNQWETACVFFNVFNNVNTCACAPADIKFKTNECWVSVFKQ